MNILDELRRDHDHLRPGLERLENPLAGAAELRLFLAELEEHNRLEEELLLRDIAPDLRLEGGLIDELRSEHERISMLGAAIRASGPSFSDSESHRRRLADLVPQHFAKEEQALFVFAERLLDADWRAGRGAAFLQSRGRHALRVGPEVRVADLARDSPATIRVFQRHGIDFCCGGKRGLREACDSKGATYDAVASELAAVLEVKDPELDGDWSSRPAVELVGHLLSRYHAGLREELVRLEAMAMRAAERHGAQNPELVTIQGLVRDLRRRMTEHLELEERAIFPALLSGDVSGLRKDIRAAEEEHELVGGLLERLREATGGFKPPADACNTWRGLYHGLAELERDTHVHVHLENNVLFDRAALAATN